MKLLGLLSTLFLAGSLIGIEAKWGPDRTKTFSRLVAQSNRAITFYFLVFLIFLSTFSVFMFGWFAPHFNLPLSFAAIYGVGVFAQGICITIPETGDLKTKIHLTAAGVMSSSVFAQTILIATLIQLPLAIFIVALGGLLIMALSWVGYILKLGFIKHELAIQSLYFSGYLATILLTTYFA